MKPYLALLVKNDMSRLSECVWLLVVFVVLVMACPLIALVDGTLGQINSGIDNPGGVARTSAVFDKYS